MTNALDVLLPGPSGPPEGVTLRFGVVTQVSPLMVRLERDADPSYVNATCVAVDALDAQFGTPVLVAKSGDRLIITNRLGDPGSSSGATLHETAPGSGLYAVTTT